MCEPHKGLLGNAYFPIRVFLRDDRDQKSQRRETNFLYRGFLAASTVALCGEADSAPSPLRCDLSCFHHAAVHRITLTDDSPRVLQQRKKGTPRTIVSCRVVSGELFTGPREK